MTELEALKWRGRLIGGNYLLGEVLGVGGMGIVYEAVQRSLARDVAVKMPRAELAACELVQRRFCMEAFVASRLSHGNIVSVIDFGYCERVPYLVMERSEGVLVGQMVRDQGALPAALAIDLAAQVLDALAAAHGCGIVHADVKSENVNVETRRDGKIVARLFDFGLACSPEWREGSDERAVVYGTPDYMAPELIRGDQPSHASDLYAVGVLLYEMLVGVTPFTAASSAQVFMRLRDETAVPPSQRVELGTAAKALDAVVLRAIAKQPEERFADAQSFAAALRALRPDAVEAASDAIRTRRSEVGHCITRGNVDEIVTSYLALARTLLDEHHPDAAAAELEEAIELLHDDGELTGSVWCLHITLAALYGHVGDHERALATVETARRLAVRAGSAVGTERARVLAARLRRATHDEEPRRAQASSSG
jgi:serine/threonine protein kinase